MEAHTKQLFEYMVSANRDGASELMDKMLHDELGTETIITKVLNPALIRIGKLWGKSEASLSQTFVAGKIAEDILLRCLKLDEGKAKESKGPIVIGNIEDDFHPLGRRIVSSFLQASGWEVHDLGNDVPAEDFIEKALEVNAPVIGVSAMMQSSALNIARVRKLLDERGLASKIKLAVGGAVFNWRPELIDEVGGDGSVTHAGQADELFDRLKAEVEAGDE